jgi:hypothetical protein
MSFTTLLHLPPSFSLCRRMQGLWHWKSDVLTTRLDLNYDSARSHPQLGSISSANRLDLIHNAARSHPQIGSISYTSRLDLIQKVIQAAIAKYYIQIYCTVVCNYMASPTFSILLHDTARQPPPPRQPAPSKSSSNMYKDLNNTAAVALGTKYGVAICRKLYEQPTALIVLHTSHRRAVGRRHVRFKYNASWRPVVATRDGQTPWPNGRPADTDHISDHWSKLRNIVFFRKKFRKGVQQNID